jgi:WD40 repeat protein
MIDGALVVIDLILGLEKNYLEKHPAKVTCIAFYEDKVVISGSVDGRVNLSDLENMNSRKKQHVPKFLKC